jgi:hypothetical protein
MTTPTAHTITVREVLGKLEAEYAVVADAVENGEYALWVGSGISRLAPDLGQLIERAFEYIRERAIDPTTKSAYMPALEEILGYADIQPENVTGQFDQPLKDWPEHDLIIGRLWNKYSCVLDIRVEGTALDHILWDAIDIRDAFHDPAPPASEHLSIAVLVLEGAIQYIASANWDGFIEAAVDELSDGLPGVMQVVVDPDQLRDPPGRAELLKFHGCIVHASSEPTIFRRFLTGSRTQITDWPETPEFRAMCNKIVGLATAKKTFVLGLSIQDNNLQTLFARAKNIHAWPWPCAPEAPAHVFCEDRIQGGQRDVLRISYGDAYNDNAKEIHDATLMRAWGENVLIALVLKLLVDKLVRLVGLSLIELEKEPLVASIEAWLKILRDDIAGCAIPAPGVNSRTEFVKKAISQWSRMLSLFRTGVLPKNPDAYETLSNATPNLISTDHNARALGLGRLGIALALLQSGRSAGLWELSEPASSELTSGAMTARASRPESEERPLFVVRSATESISLQSQGAFEHTNAIVIHADDSWHQMTRDGPSARRVRTAPGRTGSVGAVHISLGDLLMRCGDAGELHNEFIMDIML